MPDPTLDVVMQADTVRVSLILASDQIKQLMTVSTFAITLSMVFMKDTLANRQIMGWWKFGLLSTSFALQSMSILFGYLALGRLTGLTLDSNSLTNIDISKFENFGLAFLQFCAFFLGLLCGGFFVLWSLASILKQKDPVASPVQQTTAPLKINTVHEQPQTSTPLDRGYVMAHYGVS
ncbi:MAG: hypothetical protein ACRC8S_04485 [Fimbriiglobus sp.]